MTIFYAASYTGSDRFQKYHDLIKEVLKTSKVSVKFPEKIKTGDPILTYYESVRAGISQSDAVIFEVSHEDFQLGYELNQALLLKKPTLCLSVFEDFSQKIENRFFFAAKYDEYSISEIITDFINNAKKGHLTERFNMFLSPAQLLHL